MGRTLEDFNRGTLDADGACSRLGIGRTRLYQLRTSWLHNRKSHSPGSSGGDRRGSWPQHVHDFLEDFLPLQSPPNYQLVSDELLRLCEFRRARSTVAAYVSQHFAHLVPHPPAKKRGYRRFRRASIGELWQHDSSIHQWWPAPGKQHLILTIDDHSAFVVAGRFVSADTTWNHFCHFRQAFETHGIPQLIYTDALSLFGPSSSDDRRDPKSEFQRALKAIHVAHLVAPTPQAKGKIERSFGTFQKRLVTLMAHAKVADWKHANELLQMEIERRNQTINRTTGRIPAEVWRHALEHHSGSMRPCPAGALLDLHLSLRGARRVNNDSTIDFEGRSYSISHTKRKAITIIHHPGSRFWAVEHPPKDVWPPVLGAFTLR